VDRGEEVALRVYLDRSVIEVFLNDRICITDRIYPADTASTGIAVIGQAHLTSLEAWEMGDAFEDA
jgi:beta-fructofuranosidase